MGFIQLPKQIVIAKGEKFTIKLEGGYPELFYAKVIVSSDIFSLPNDIIAIEKGLVFEGSIESVGTIVFDIEQVWGAELDPEIDYKISVVIEEPVQAEEVVKESEILQIINSVETQYEYVEPTYHFEGFMAKVLKKSVNSNIISVIVKSEIAQTIGIKTSWGKLSKENIVFENRIELSSAFFTFPEKINKGLIFGLRISYLSNVTNIMLPAGVVLNGTWKKDLQNQLQLLAELDQLDWSWYWVDEQLHATAPPKYQGYKVEWLTSPDVALSKVFFSAPYSDEIQKFDLHIKDKDWLEKTVVLEIESKYKAKNQSLELKLVNSNSDLFLTTDQTVIDSKTINRVYFELNTVLSNDFSGRFNIGSDTLKKWTDIKLLKDTISIPVGSTSDYIEIQSMNKKPGLFELHFDSNQRNVSTQKWKFEIADSYKAIKEADLKVDIKTVYKNDSVLFYLTPIESLTKTKEVNVLIGTDTMKLNIQPGKKTSVLKYRKIVNGVVSLSINIDGKGYIVLAYDKCMPEAVVNIGGKWKLSKQLPVDLLMVENSGKATLINAGQSWLPDFEADTTLVEFKTKYNQSVFKQEVNVSVKPPVLSLSVVNNSIVIESNYKISKPLTFEITVNSEQQLITLNPGDKKWFKKLNKGFNSIKVLSQDTQIVNNKTEVWV